LNGLTARWFPCRNNAFAAIGWRFSMNQSDRTLRTINDGDPFAMRYWSKQLRISECDLRKAIAAVGTSTQAVRQYTNRPKTTHASCPRGAERHRGG
jgi:hypothetical protein